MLSTRQCAEADRLKLHREAWDREGTRLVSGGAFSLLPSVESSAPSTVRLDALKSALVLGQMWRSRKILKTRGSMGMTHLAGNCSCQAPTPDFHEKRKSV